MENYKNKKSVKFQGDMLNFCDFIQVFVFTRNHHLKVCEYTLVYTWTIRSMNITCINDPGPEYKFTKSYIYNQIFPSFGII